MIPICILAIEDEDDRAFMENLYMSYQRLMYSTIKRIVRDDWAAEDVMQSALVKLIDKIPLLKSRTDVQRISYVVTASRNTALDYMRKQARHGPDSSFDEIPDSDLSWGAVHEVERVILEKADFSALSRVWDRLDDRSKYLLEGYYILEKTPAELGKELSIKPDSVRMALSRARKAAYKLIAADQAG
ncbi:RNA polymerase sigma factor [uncultured Pseudoflavonifractor sp.]|uniref:RNA polymerase sigma factor n=1 Tax=uncultured Pseudoflavonifractor sp. TaxID=1221379 RepID=UPI0025EC9E1A|nr:sigma-70 family RNA polymerase sigma factor [uncultured Pseudoflavonifractor sp.]